MVASEQSRPDVARRRDQWLKYQSRIDAARLVFIDETWVKTNMAPLRGWSARGTRLKGDAPFGHWNTTTFLASLGEQATQDKPATRTARAVHRESGGAGCLIRHRIAMRDGSKALLAAILSARGEA